MATLELHRIDNVFVIELINGDQDNTLTLDVLDEWFSALDSVQEAEGNIALLIHSRHQKTFSTGIDLKWLEVQSRESAAHFSRKLENLLLRIASLDLPTVVAINGNCYAGGALIACACDYRYMRIDRGRFCFPEVKLEMPFTPIMLDIVKLLPNERALYELSLTAEAWGGEVCKANGIIDEAVAIEQLYDVAFAKAQQLSTKHRPTLSKHKRFLRERITSLAEAREVLRR